MSKNIVLHPVYDDPQYLLTIKEAHARGANVQYANRERFTNNEYYWIETDTPLWSNHCIYRLVPTVATDKELFRKTLKKMKEDQQLILKQLEELEKLSFLR